MKKLLAVLWPILCACTADHMVAEDDTPVDEGHKSTERAVASGGADDGAGVTPDSPDSGEEQQADGQRSQGEAQPAAVARSAQARLSASAWTACAALITRIDECGVEPCECEDEPCDCPDFTTEVCVESVFGQFLGYGDPCAEVGIALLDCYLAASCDELRGPEPAPCVGLIEQSVSSGTCPRLEFTDPPDSAGARAVAIADGDYGGAPVSVARPTLAPAAPSGPLVLCDEGTESAWPSGGPDVPTTDPCQTGADGCTDGHTYDVFCETPPTEEGVKEQRYCDCLVDGVSEYTFKPGVPDCPESLAEMNAACGWNLAWR